MATQRLSLVLWVPECQSWKPRVSSYTEESGEGLRAQVQEQQKQAPPHPFTPRSQLPLSSWDGLQPIGSFSHSLVKEISHLAFSFCAVLLSANPVHCRTLGAARFLSVGACLALWPLGFAGTHFFTCSGVSALIVVAGVLEGPSEVPEREVDRRRMLKAVPGTRMGRRVAGRPEAGRAWVSIPLTQLCSRTQILHLHSVSRPGIYPRTQHVGTCGRQGQSQEAQPHPHSSVSLMGERRCRRTAPSPSQLTFSSLDTESGPGGRLVGPTRLSTLPKINASQAV